VLESAEYGSGRARVEKAGRSPLPVMIDREPSI